MILIIAFIYFKGNNGCHENFMDKEIMFKKIYLYESIETYTFNFI